MPPLNHQAFGDQFPEVEDFQIFKAVVVFDVVELAVARVTGHHHDFGAGGLDLLGFDPALLPDQEGKLVLVCCDKAVGCIAGYKVHRCHKQSLVLQSVQMQHGSVASILTPRHACFGGQYQMP